MSQLSIDIDFNNMSIESSLERESLEELHDESGQAPRFNIHEDDSYLGENDIDKTSSISPDRENEEKLAERINTLLENSQGYLSR